VARILTFVPPTSTTSTFIMVVLLAKTPVNQSLSFCPHLSIRQLTSALLTLWGVRNGVK
jgi:hypothetical protein